MKMLKMLGIALTASSLFAGTFGIESALGKPERREPRSPTPGVSTGGLIDRFKGIDGTGFVCTTSTTFVDMPGTAQNFTTSKKNRVVALFTGEFGSLAAGETASIQLVIDGIPQKGPGANGQEFPITNGTDGNQAGGFNFISQTLLAGTHTAVIRWRVLSGTEVCVDERSFIILYFGG